MQKLRGSVYTKDCWLWLLLSNVYNESKILIGELFISNVNYELLIFNVCNDVMTDDDTGHDQVPGHRSQDHTCHDSHQTLLTLMS